MNKIDFSELYTLHYKRIFHISFSITRDSYLAEDVVQETFIKAMKKVETIQDKQKVGAWLAVIAGRTALDFVRKEKRKTAIPMEHEMIECLGIKTMQNVEQEVQTGFIAEEIHSAIRQLTRDYQDVLFLKLDQGLKDHEIASILDLKPSTVKTRIFRARKQLKMMVQMSA